MTSPELERLVIIGQLKREPGAQHTLGLGPEVWRVLATCHQRRNALEYEGHLEVDERLVADLLKAAETVYQAVLRLGLVQSSG